MPTFDTVTITTLASVASGAALDSGFYQNQGSGFSPLELWIGEVPPGGTAPTALSVPQNVTTSQTSSTGTITWEPPASDGGSPVTGYRVARDGVDTGGYGAYTTVVPAADRSFTMFSLRAGDFYNLTVSAITAQGESAKVSRTIQIAGTSTGGGGTGTAPEQPTVLTANRFPATEWVTDFVDDFSDVEQTKVKWNINTNAYETQDGYWREGRAAVPVPYTRDGGKTIQFRDGAVWLRAVRDSTHPLYNSGEVPFVCGFMSTERPRQGSGPGVPDPVQNKAKYRLEPNGTYFVEGELWNGSAKGTLSGFWLLGDTFSGDSLDIYGKPRVDTTYTQHWDGQPGYGKTAGWPTGGEVDILEFPENASGDAGRPFSSLHWARDHREQDQYAGSWLYREFMGHPDSYSGPARPQLQDSWHKWGLYRSPHLMVVYIDGVELCRWERFEGGTPTAPATSGTRKVYTAWDGPHTPASVEWWGAMHIVLTYTPGAEWGMQGGVTLDQAEEGEFGARYVKVWKKADAAAPVSAQPKMGVFRNYQNVGTNADGTTIAGTTQFSHSVVGYETWLGRKMEYVEEFQETVTDTWKLSWPDYMRNYYTAARLGGRSICLGSSLSPVADRTANPDPYAYPRTRTPSWAAMSTGALDTVWADLGKNLVSSGLKDAILRGAHEFNIDAFQHQVRPGEEAAFIAAWRRWHGILRANGFTGKFHFNPVAGMYRQVDAVACYPGDAYVDVIDLDMYDEYYGRGTRPGSTAAAGTGEGPRSLAEQQTNWTKQVGTTASDQRGLAYWRAFAVAHLKGMAFSEWGMGDYFNSNGLNYGGGDNAWYVERMADFILDPAYPPGSPGGVVYHAFWEHDKGNGVQPNSAANPDSDRAIPVPKAREVFLRRFGGTQTGTGGSTPATLTGFDSQVVTRGGGYVTGTSKPTDSTIYARTDVGGAYRYDASTDFWTQIITTASVAADRHESDYMVDAIEQAPSNSSVVYVAVGNSPSAPNNLAGRVLRSDNRGVTWSAGPRLWDVRGNAEWRYGTHRLAVHPTTPMTVLYGSRLAGLQRSTDGGATWTRLTALPAASGEETWNPLGVTAVVYDPTDASRIYAAVRGVGLCLSTNGGTSWTTVHAYSGGWCSDIEITSTGTVWACFMPSSGNGEVIRHTKAGVKTVVTPGARRWTTVAVDPTNEARVMLADNHVLTAADGVNRMYRTTNGTAATPTWTPMNIAIDPGSRGTRWVATHVGVDTGQMRFKHDGTGLWFASGFGMWFTSDLGDSTATFVFTSDGIEELVANVALKPPGKPLLTATWDKGLWQHPNPTSRTPGSGEAALLPHVDQFGSAWDLVASPTDPNLVAAILNDHQNAAGTSNPQRKASARSLAGGAAGTWSKFGSLVSDTHPADCMFGNIAISAGTGSARDNMVWVPSNLPYGAQKVYRTTDGGASWTAATLTGQVAGDYLHPAHFLHRYVLVAHPTTPGTFYVLGGNNNTGDTALWRSTDSGATFAKVTTTGLNRAGYYDMRFNSRLVVAGGYLYALPGTTDGGDRPFFRAALSNVGTWTEMTSMLNAHALGVGAPAAGSTNPTLWTWGRKVAAGPDALYYSRDHGATWTLASTSPRGLYDAVTVVAGDPEDASKAYLGYGGNGFLVGRL